MWRYRRLTRSIIGGAREVIAERLVGEGSPEMWCDGRECDRGWEGPHVEKLCASINAELQRFCEELAQIVAKRCSPRLRRARGVGEVPDARIYERTITTDAQTHEKEGKKP